MLLNKFEKIEFLVDWMEMPMDELSKKYNQNSRLIKLKAKSLDLPKRPRNWWPQSKETQLKNLFKIKSPVEIMAILEISDQNYYSKVKQLGLKK